MSEELRKEEFIDEGEIVEVDVPEEKVSGKIADLAPDEEADASIENISESTEVKTEDELADYSDKVKKRIGNLTRKLREAERGQDSAYEYAKKISYENEVLKNKSSTLDRSYLNEAQGRLKSQKAQALSALKGAHEVADYDKVEKAQEVLAKIAVEENKVVTSQQQLEYQRNVQEEQRANYQNYAPQQQAQPQAQQPIKLDQKTQSWAENNAWFGDDEIMTVSAYAIHNNMVEEDFDAGTDEYYTELDRRIRKEFPQKFNESSVTKSKPSQKVASAGRVAGNAGSNKRQVKLSPAEVQMAKRLNVPLNEYAKYVKR